MIMQSLVDRALDIATIDLGRRTQAVVNVTAFVTFSIAARNLIKNGVWATFGDLVSALLSSVPGASAALDSQLEKEAQDAMSDFFDVSQAPVEGPVPLEGIPSEKILRELESLKASDVDPAKGETFAYVYTPFEKSAWDLTEKAAVSYGNYNALNPIVFPSLRKMEVEVVSMCRWMTGDVQGVCGSMTSGGTESILMAIKVAREYARQVRGIKYPEVVIPVSGHPAFAKAGHYLGVKMVWTKVNEKTTKADVQSMRSAITANTCLLVGSAPAYPCGVMDPIEEIASLAKEKGLLMHVDACYGGFVLPWLPKIGVQIPKWDFSVDGVTSISMDAHKYGFTAKGASCVLYRSRDLRRFQFYSYIGWTGGLFVSPSMLGTRGGGPIASCWATMRHYGQNGYMSTVKRMMETTKYIIDTVRDLDTVEIVGNPCMTSLAIKATRPNELNILAVADVMEKQGWKMEKNASPPSIHMTVMPPHSDVKEKLMNDMKNAIKTVTTDPAKYNAEGSAAMYGMVAKIPSGTIVEKFMVHLMDVIYTRDFRT
eukprot:m.8756 g.8756  ORF g.8756 m.8756 type:complete len:540 (+) comp3951_c1_seq1:260-1879(+)